MMTGCCRTLLLASALAACAPAASPCAPSFVAVSDVARPDDPSLVDLVFVLDRTASVAEHLPRIIEQLSSVTDPPCISRSTAGGGPRHACDPNNPDDVRVSVPVTSLRVGVVSSDLGARGAGVAACETPRGDDARLDAAQRRPAPDRACAALAPAPAFLSFCSYGDECSDLEPSVFVTDPSQIAAQTSCRARALGVGCSFGQPLEALWRALVQHGAGEPAGSAAPNAGFLREQALLAMVVVSDREDHSARDCDNDLGFSLARGAGACVDGTAAFSPAARGWASDDVDARFYRAQAESAQDPTWPIDRYVGERPWRSGDWRTLDSLKPGHPERLLFVAVTGVPVRVPTSDAGVRWEQLLGSSPDGSNAFRTRNASDSIAATQDNGAPFSMRDEPSPRCPHVVPACVRESAPYQPDRACADAASLALPARRIVEVARRFDEAARCNGQPCRNGQLRSICANVLDWTALINARIERRGARPCVFPEVRAAPGADGTLTVSCVLREVQAPGVTGCDATRGRVELADPAARSTTGSRGEPLHVCEVRQLPTRSLERGGGLAAAGGVGWYADFRRNPRSPECPWRLSYASGSAPAPENIAQIDCSIPRTTCP